MDENMFNVAVRTDDISEGRFVRQPNAVRFTTAGPLTLDSVWMAKAGLAYKLTPYLRNNGTTYTVRKGVVHISCSDPWVTKTRNTSLLLPDLAPGCVAGPPSPFFLVWPDSTFPRYFNVKVEVSVDGWTYWVDSMRVDEPIPGVSDGDNGLPAAVGLEQNYPNPFNPSTTIKYALPQSAMVRLSVYDMLGREVSVLVNERRDAGVHEVKFDGSNLASGVYFYRLKAGEFVQTKKLLFAH